MSIHHWLRESSENAMPTGPVICTDNWLGNVASYLFGIFSISQNDQNAFLGAYGVCFSRNELLRIQNDKIYAFIQVSIHFDKFEFWTYFLSIESPL